MSQACPICAASLEPQARYPHHVCGTCASRACSADGRRLVFSNGGLDGGYVATYADNSEPYDRHDCWIDGIACHADEARFGGIVIECRKQPAAAAGTTGKDQKGIQQ